MRYGLKSIERGRLGPWLELAPGMTHKGGVITFENAIQARTYASNAGFRGEVQIYNDSLPTIEAVRGECGWTYQ